MAESTLPAEGTSAAEKTATADIALRIGDRQLKMKVTAPLGDVGLKELLPLMQSMASHIVQIGEENVAESGKTISCQKGCGACCRQMVPIAPVEAHGIRDLVNNLPEPRKTEILNRFAAAKEKMSAAGMWQKMDERATWPEADVVQTGLDYFHLGVACPFLEEESCSIHLDRPMACREYLVTSPAANCSNPSAHVIEMVPIPGKVWPIASYIEQSSPQGKYLPWVPLIQALDFAESHEEGPQRPGTEWVREIFTRLAKAPVASAPSANPNLPT
jgi:Fe-S-cluster containining protein